MKKAWRELTQWYNDDHQRTIDVKFIYENNGKINTYMSFKESKSCCNEYFYEIAHPIIYFTGQGHSVKHFLLQ